MLTVITHHEDEIIVFDPNYASYNNAIAIAGGKLKYCALNEDLSFNFENLEKLISPNTKAVVFSNPNNPTGLILDLDEIQQILERVKGTDIFVVCDEVYKDFLLEDSLNFSSAAAHFSKYSNNLVIINSWSKTFSITGWRVGYLIASELLVNEVIKVHDSLVTCAPSIAQYGISNSLGVMGEWNIKIVHNLRENREMVIEELSQLSSYISFEKPTAGYYVFPRFLYTDDDYKECMRILNKAHVSVVP